MKPQSGLWIGGEWIQTPEQVTITNPATDEPVGISALGDRSHLDRAVAAATSAFETVRRQPAFERADLLRRIAQEIQLRRAAFVDLIVSESGKPVTLAEIEVNRAIDTFTVAAEESRRFQGEALSIDAFASGKGHSGWARRFPIGVIYAITPFNFPLNLVAHKLAPCIATGNACVLKPAPKTPLTAWLLAEALAAAGVPAGQVNVVTCGNQDAGHLVGDSRVALTSFTGSPEVGWRIKERSGRQKVLLELGGNAAVIVHEDADLSLAVPAIATGGLANAGQSCISVQRILVHRPIYEAFRDQLVDHVRNRVVLGDPRDPRTLVGPLIDEGAVHRILGWVQQASAAGARVLTGGKARGRFLEPTLLEEARPEMDVCAQEVFGPLMTLQPYDRFDEALRLVNDSKFGLQAGVFTRDLARAFRAFEELQVGGVMINNVPTFRVENMPYGGIKDSGLGREGVRSAMEEMTEVRSLIVRNP